MKRSWAQVQGFFGQLGPTERWLIGALLIILVFVGAVVIQYAGRAETVAISGFTGERAAVVVGKLRERGIEAVIQDGQVRVPEARWADALVALEQSEMLSSDLVSAFDDMMANQSVWSSSSQRDRQYLIAKQKVLSSVISRMKGVKSAVVVIDVPKQDRFARPMRPSASVSLSMQGNTVVDRGLVESVAGVVSGAVVDMKPQEVVVIGNGRRYTVKDELDQLPEEAWQMVKKLEHHHRDKIEQMLSYIPNVIVAVSVRTDSITRKVVKTREFGNEAVKRQTDEETESKTSRPAGRAGARANTESAIGPGNADSTTSKMTRSDVEFSDKPVTMESDHVEAGHKLKQVSATINVPRSFFVNLYRQSNPDAKDEPDAAAVDALAQKELKAIADQVEPHINTAETQGVVRTHMINDGIAKAAIAAQATPPSGMLAMMQGEWVRPIGLGVLALAAMGFLMRMVQKSTDEQDMPTAEELAGVPPSLPSDDELVGEADETNVTMEGIELDDGELRFRQLADQIGDLIKTNPGEASNLLGKWVRVGD